MAMEEDKALVGLQTAVQMEISGKEYYLKAGRQSSNEMGKRLLEKLAAEEDVHRRKFEEIYAALRQKKGWPATDFQPDGGRRLRTIFMAEMGARAPVAGGSSTELDSVKLAIGMESKTYDFYLGQSQSATYPGEAEFYEILCREEREHRLVLLDYQEYLQDPAGWSVMKEHRLDGG
ncbi:MAG: ferritin family protein [Chloroflexota bacterium]